MWRITKKRLKRCLSRKLILFLLLICSVLLTIFLIYSHRSSSNGLLDETGIRWRSDHTNGGEDICECAGWRNHFDAGKQEKRIFESVRLEHIHLLEKLEEASAKLDAINKLIPLREAELKELDQRIEELKLLQKEYSDRRNVQLKLPHSPIFPPEIELEKENAQQQSFLFFEDIIDFSRCSISSLFRVYIYPLPNGSTDFAKNLHSEFLNLRPYITTNADQACIFVAILENVNFLDHLTYYGSNGRNHLLIDLTGKLRPEMVAAALLVSHRLDAKNSRPTIDIPAHLHIPHSDPNRWKSLPQLLQTTRKYLLSFIATPHDLNRRQLEDFSVLKKSMEASQDAYLVDLECSAAESNSSSLCYHPEERHQIGQQSTFSLIFANSSTFQQRFYESLKAGSVPVICSLHQPLPFEEMVDWRLAAIRISPSRFPELHFILRSISTSDLIEMRRKGRFFFENILADKQVLAQSILSLLRYRLQAPGREEPEPNAVPLYNSTNGPHNWTYPFYISTATKPPYDDEFLGSIEVPVESTQYAHNFTSFSLYASILWNHFPFATIHSPRFLMNDHPLPSNAEFNADTSFGMRPISPGSGVEFAHGLGGNRPREQFTILIVSFNREHVLANTLERLIGLPHLNRVIVVWNDAQQLPSIPAWPRLHVPLLFINGTRNSLNNRFIPYKEIETEAVLSMDDDIDLKQYEIIFAFRVWREQRDRLVGFPARYHARFGDDNFYNSNHTCQFSMILTGAAFLHKFFLHVYTFNMPSIIRQKVDEWMNCEDLAMNFLVSHLTRKPPIKTTSKWTLRCPTCAETLSNDMEHFNERHECIRFFTRVYGYNPLLFTQFRADSVLFKTRVPANHQKCFRYV